MIGAIGFTLIKHGSVEQHKKAAKALSSALSHFPDLRVYSVEIGVTRLVLWGREGVEQCTHRMPDGSLLVLIGSPIGKTSWTEVENALTAIETPEEYQLPWDGRVILLHISSDGTGWTIWNDWMGSIPVFYATFPHWRIASTLEPVVVTAAYFSIEGIYLPALIVLLMHGNYQRNWTLYKDMKTIPADSVTTITQQECRLIERNTIHVSDTRSEYGWNDLIEEMNHLVRESIRQVLDLQPKWIVPLSGGLDSRLIAAVGAEIGTDMQTYTWGPSNTLDGVYARQIARTLHLPWQRINLGDDYLVRCLPLWRDLFGSYMHFHGMYQIPFYEFLRGKSKVPIITGYIGEVLAGYEVSYLVEFLNPGDKTIIFFGDPYDMIWPIDELKKLFNESINTALEEIADMVKSTISMLEGPWFQKLHFLSLWGRQNHFTYFQSMLSDYYCGVATPFVNRDYARFCMSLPRAALDNRRLQIDMMRRYYAKVMTIGGTYDRDPAVLTGRYLLKRRAAKMLPSPLVRMLLPGFSAAQHIQTDIASLRACGRGALWPIPDTRSLLAEWINLELVDQAYKAALAGDMLSVRKLQSLQAFAYRLRGQ